MAGPSTTVRPAEGRHRPSRVRAILAISRNDLLRLVRDRTALFFIVVLPVVIIIIIGATIGAAPSKLPVGVLDLDRTASSERLVAALGANPAVEPKTYEDEAELRQDIRVQNLYGGLVIPAGYEATVLRGDTATVAFLADQNSSSSMTLSTVLGNIVDREGQELAAAAFATRSIGGDRAANLDRARTLSADIRVIGVQVETVGRGSLESTNRYAYTAPSNLVLFVFVNSLTGGAAMVESRQLGVSRRMLAGPVHAGTIVAGAGFTRFGVAMLQSVLILGVGAFVFGVSWGNPFAATALVLTFALLATGGGLLIGTLAKTPEQATSIGIPVAIGMAMLGGCMWPLEIVPAGVRAAGHLTPHAWAMDGWIAVIFEGKGIDAIVTDLLVLGAMAAALITLAAWRLRRSLGS